MPPPRFHSFSGKLRALSTEGNRSGTKLSCYGPRLLVGSGEGRGLELGARVCSGVRRVNSCRVCASDL